MGCRPSKARLRSKNLDISSSLGVIPVAIKVKVRGEVRVEVRVRVEVKFEVHCFSKKAPSRRVSLSLES